MSLEVNTIETPCHRRYFFVGGSYVEESSPMGGYTMKGQTYVECLTPIVGVKKEFPLIFVHGGGQSGLVRDPILAISCTRWASPSSQADLDLELAPYT